MGFCYGTNYRTGRQCLACDFCSKADGTVKKIPCPYGWCQAWATCAICKKQGKHKYGSMGIANVTKEEEQKLRDNHAQCKLRKQESERKLDTFKRGGLHLYIFHDAHGEHPATKGMFIVDNEWYSTSCDVLKRTWLNEEHLKTLREMGHTLSIHTVRNSCKPPSGFFLLNPSTGVSLPLEKAFA